MAGKSKAVAANPTIQTIFLETLKQKLPPNVSLADELAEALNISRDSAYRRIRGETVLSLDEARALCNQYKVSLDSLLSPTPDLVSFQVRNVGAEQFTIHDWLSSILGNLDMLVSFEQKEMIYSAKDVPVFYYFQNSEFAEFKLYFWSKVILNYPNLSDVKYKPGIMPKETVRLGERTWEKFSSVPCTEIWSLETPRITLRQIEFCHDCGYFEEPLSAVRLTELYRDQIKKFRSWAETGTKPGGGSLKLYKNDVLIADNTVYFKISDRRVAFITYNGMNILTTMQPAFCRLIEEYLVHSLNNAQLISTTGEKERSRFFNAIEAELDAFIKRLN